MKVLIASDSFKGSASSLQVANSIEKGILKVFSAKELEITKVQIADGGEGTLDTFKDALNIPVMKVKVHDPLGRLVESEIGILQDKKFIIEMANASGIMLLNEDELNPDNASSYGTGELILKCLDNKANEIYIGIGGSATNDCGIGMLAALGVKFFNKNGEQLKPIGSSIHEVNDFNLDELDSRLKNVSIKVLTDVTNPLYGDNGASHIFGPQKGLKKDQVEMYDDSIRKFSLLVKNKTGLDFSLNEGSGAAGGLGYSIRTFLGGELLRGVETILEMVGFNIMVSKSDLVFSGEGKIDEQTLSGKAIIGVLKSCSEYQKPLIVISGSIPDNLDQLYNKGFKLVNSIVNKPMSLMDSIKNVDTLIEIATENIMRTIKLGQELK